MEEWKDIPNYEGFYQASTEGRIKKLNHGKNKVERIVFKAQDNCGYLRCCLTKDKKSNMKHIHILVAMTFLNHIQNGHKAVVDHIDGDKKNNNLSNLQVISHRENIIKGHQLKRILPPCVSAVKNKKLGEKYKALTNINGKPTHLGVFNTIKEAEDAVFKARNVVPFKNLKRLFD